MKALLPTGTPARQRGVVLVVALLMLLILTMIGVAATRSTALEERMTANQNDRAVAFQAAEAALRYGEGLLSAASQPDFTANTAGAFSSATMGDVTWQNIDWTSSSTQTEPYGYGIASSGQNLIVTGNGSGSTTSYQAPRYYIVYSVQPVPGTTSSLSTDAQLTEKTAYYIYARGWGQSPNTTVTLEAIDSF